MNERLDYIFKKATQEDIRGISELDKKCFAVPWTTGMFVNDICENMLTEYIVVYDCDCVIGYGGMWVILDEAHITNICTHPDYRRQGIARQTMSQLFGILACRGVHTVTLEVRVSNVPAMRLYEEFGFHISGKRKGYYSDNGEDAFIMWAENPADIISGKEV